MKTPHKHAELIKAWADGAEIQYRYNANIPWHDATSPQWWEYDCEYRIKPAPKPDQVVYPHAAQYQRENGYSSAVSTRGQLKLTFDGETGKLKSAEVL